MMVWTGFGWLGYAILVAAFFGSAAGLDFLFGAGFARQHSVVLAVCSFVVDAALCWPVGRFFNRRFPVRVFDKAALRDRSQAHTTFFVRLEFAGIVAIPFLIYVAVVGLDGLRRR